LTTDTGSSGGSSARRRRGHARAGDLRDAALALFVEKGFDATLTEEIAARAGVSKGTLYLYYRGKEELLHATTASPAFEALARLRPAAERDGTSAEALRRVLAEVRLSLQDEAVSSVLKLAIAESRRYPKLMEDWLRTVARPARSLIASVLVQGMARGEFHQGDPDAVAHSLLLPMFMLCLGQHLIDTDDPADRCLDPGFISKHLELVLQGLGRRDRQAPKRRLARPNPAP
jgi:AcrR family transcriptional regulator